MHLEIMWHMTRSSKKHDFSQPQFLHRAVRSPKISDGAILNVIKCLMFYKIRNLARWKSSSVGYGLLVDEWLNVFIIIMMLVKSVYTIFVESIHQNCRSLDLLFHKCFKVRNFVLLILYKACIHLIPNMIIE